MTIAQGMWAKVFKASCRDGGFKTMVTARKLVAFCCIIVAVGLSACAPRQLPLAPAVQQPLLTDGAIIARDGRAIPYRLFQADPELAVIVGLHGFNDYRLAFDLVGPLLAEQGITLIAYDQRGFGAHPDAGQWPGRENLVRDLQDVVTVVGGSRPDVPLYVMGESMGGAVSLVAGARPEIAEQLDGLILSAPATWGWSQMNFFYRSSLWLVAHIAPGWELSGRGLGRVASDNTDALIEMGRDPLVIKETRVGTVYGLVGLMDDAARAPGALDLPVLMLYGEKDEIMPGGPVETLAEDLESALKERFDFVSFSDGYHLLLRDSIRQDVADRIGQFVLSSKIRPAKKGIAAK